MTKINCITRWALTMIGLLSGILLSAQNASEDRIKTTHFPAPREIVNSHIPGAPILSQPKQIQGTKQEIRTEKHGLIYPAFFDWNNDGKKDLLLGEFETGDTGSNIKVYLNQGSDAEPSYSGEYFYATDINGDTITNHQWCCIGIHPRMVDLDGDGYLDILSGQYNPGAISWWRGSKEGFLPRVFVEQEGYINSTTGYSNSRDPLSPDSNPYWNYTSADFADFNGDGLLDLFVGGSGGPRVALNVGTREKPKFGLRKYIYYTDGEPVTISITDKSGYERKVGKSYLAPIDWDGDGILDILMTHEYSDPGHNPIEFLKGVNTPEGLRFEKPVALFTAADGDKALPGCQPMITIADYNNDGIKDIVFGLSIPTINGFEAAPEIAWRWIHDVGIQMPGKDSGRSITYSGGVKGTIERIEKEPMMRSYYLGKLDDYKYLTLQHRGYVFVMYGARDGNTVKATQQHTITPVNENRVAPQQEKGPVSYEINIPEKIKPGKAYTAEVTISIAEGWHGYADLPENMGFTPTTVKFELPDEFENLGISTSMESSALYFGDGNTFSQKFRCSRKAAKQLKEAAVTVHIQYQVCDENMCMPPQEHTVSKTIEL